MGIDPKNSLTHNNRGMTLAKMQRYNEALAAYDSSLEINPEKFASTH